MQLLSALFLTLLPSAILAQAPSTANIPSCAIPCIRKTLAKQTCARADLKCYCTDPTIKSTLAECLPAQCTNKADLQRIIERTNVRCKGFEGYPMPVPAAQGAKFIMTH